MREQLGRLIDHLAWADERAAQSLGAVRPPPPEPLRWFAHVVGAEHVWISRLLGRAPRVAVWPELSLEECVWLARENVRELRELLASWSEAQLAGEVAYTNSAGDAFRSRRDDILVHVALHGTYHRGQVALMLRRGGHAPAPTDYIAFVRGAPAATTDLR